MRTVVDNSPGKAVGGPGAEPGLKKSRETRSGVITGRKSLRCANKNPSP